MMDEKQIESLKRRYGSRIADAPKRRRGPDRMAVMKGGKPKAGGQTMLRLLSYLKRDRMAMTAAFFCVILGTVTNLVGAYMLRPIINRYIVPLDGSRGDVAGLFRSLCVMGAVYLVSVAAACMQSRIMLQVAQNALQRLREELFNHMQTLPLRFYDTGSNGDLMSRFTNDVDTVQEALNGTFSMLIQSFLILIGTLSMLFVLSARLTLIVLLFLVASGFFIWYNGKCSKKYFNAQQEALAAVNGFVEEMTAGQKVEKVFNHEKQDLEEFLMRSERLRKASINALTWSGMLVPVNVSMSYFNYGVSAAAGGIFALTGHMDLGTLASYLVYVRQSAMPLNQFTNQFNFLLAALSGAERIFDLMEQEPDLPAEYAGQGRGWETIQ